MWKTHNEAYIYIPCVIFVMKIVDLIEWRRVRLKLRDFSLYRETIRT